MAAFAWAALSSRALPPSVLGCNILTKAIKSSCIMPALGQLAPLHYTKIFKPYTWGAVGVTVRVTNKTICAGLCICGGDYASLPASPVSWRRRDAQVRRMRTPFHERETILGANAVILRRYQAPLCRWGLSDWFSSADLGFRICGVSSSYYSGVVRWQARALSWFVVVVSSPGCRARGESQIGP